MLLILNFADIKITVLLESLLNDLPRANLLFNQTHSSLLVICHAINIKTVCLSYWFEFDMC